MELIRNFFLISKDNIIRRVLMGKRGGMEKFGVEREGEKAGWLAVGRAECGRVGYWPVG
jgi:hypothetical protein